MQEILTKRTYNQKHYDNGDGTFTMRSHLGHIHYKDELGLLQNSNIQFTELADRWSMTEHNYQLEVAKDFAAPLLMRYRNKYEGADHTITYEPVAIAWYRPSDNDIQIFRNQQSVQGVYDQEKNSIYYTGAFGNGIDFEISLMRSGFKKEIVIPNKPAALPTPPSPQHRLVALFKYGGTATNVVDIKSRTECDNNNDFESEDGYEISDGIHKSFLRRAYAVDADRNFLRLKVAWRRKAGKLYQIKDIPLDRLEQATYPVRLDTTTTYYAHSNDGSILNRSNVGAATSSTTWDEFHDETTGEAIQEGSSNADVGIGHNGKYYGYRYYANFDTSGIDDAASITAAVIGIYINTVTDNDPSDGDSVLTIVRCIGTPDTGANSVNYFDDVGTSDGSAGTAMNTPQQKFIDDVDLGSLTTSAVNEFTVTSTGLTYISKTGYTKIGMREGHDTNDAFPNSAALSRWTQATEESANDPYIEVTYTAGTNYTQDVEESATASDNIKRDTTKAHTEAVTVAEIITKDTTKVVIENATASDNVTTLVVKLQELLEAVGVSDTIQRNITKTYTEAVTAADTIIKATTKAFTEAVNAVASATAQTATYTQVLLESVNVTASLSKVVGYVRSFTETVSVRDYIIAKLNGINAFWSDIYTETADAWSDIYSATTDDWSDIYKDN